MNTDLLFLDSANLDEIRHANESGIVAGVTTNPTLLHQALQGRETIAHVSEMLNAFPQGNIFFQLHAVDKSSTQLLVSRVLDHVGSAESRLVFKLPAQPWWFSIGAELTEAGHRVAFTAVYQPGQVLAAIQAGAEYIIPYVDRARRLRPHGKDLLESLRAVGHDHIRILAASIKSPEQAISAFNSGAHAITAPWGVLNRLMSDELTDSAIEQFHDTVPV